MTWYVIIAFRFNDHNVGRWRLHGGAARDGGRTGRTGGVSSPLRTMQRHVALHSIIIHLAR